MMENLRGDLPILGVNKIRATVGPPISLVRDLDEAATFEPEKSEVTVNGTVIQIGRSNIVTAVDLVDMIEEMVRRVVREEVEGFLVRITDD